MASPADSNRSIVSTPESDNIETVLCYAKLGQPVTHAVPAPINPATNTVSTMTQTELTRTHSYGDGLENPSDADDPDEDQSFECGPASKKPRPSSGATANSTQPDKSAPRRRKTKKKPAIVMPSNSPSSTCDEHVQPTPVRASGKPIPLMLDHLKDADRDRVEDTIKLFCATETTRTKKKCYPANCRDMKCRFPRCTFPTHEYFVMSLSRVFHLFTSLITSLSIVPRFTDDGIDHDALGRGLSQLYDDVVDSPDYQLSPERKAAFISFFKMVMDVAIGKRL